MSEPVHIRQVAELKKSVANARLMEAVLTRELSVALLIDKTLTPCSPYTISATNVIVNQDHQCIDVHTSYVGRTPPVVTRSIPFDKMLGEELKFLFDCSNINSEELEETPTKYTPTDGGDEKISPCQECEGATVDNNKCLTCTHAYADRKPGVIEDQDDEKV